MYRFCKTVLNPLGPQPGSCIQFSSQFKPSLHQAKWSRSKGLPAEQRWQLHSSCAVPRSWQNSLCLYCCLCCCYAMELETSIAQPFMKTAEIWRHCSISSRASPVTHMEPWAIGPWAPTSVGGMVSRAPGRDDNGVSCCSPSPGKVYLGQISSSLGNLTFLNYLEFLTSLTIASLVPCHFWVNSNNCSTFILTATICLESFLMHLRTAPTWPT